MKNILFLFSILSLKTFSYINIYPTYFDKPIDKNQGYMEYTLFNKKSIPVKYRCFLEPIGSDNNLVSWTEIYPKSIILKPKESKIIKVLIKSPPEAEKKQYSEYLVFKEVPANFYRTSKVNILTQLKLKINAYVGDLKPTISLLKKGQNIEITNSGKRNLNGEIFLGSKKANGLFISKINLIPGETKLIKNTENKGFLYFYLVNDEVISKDVGCL